MASPTAMSTDERERFLADVHIGMLAVAQEGAAPLVTPVWYRYEPGGVIEISTAGGSAKVAALRAAGQASLCVQREDPPYAYVAVSGPVTLGELSDEDQLDIAVRYLGPQGGQQFVDSYAGVDNVLVTLAPQRWRTVDYAKLPPT